MTLKAAKRIPDQLLGRTIKKRYLFITDGGRDLTRARQQGPKAPHVVHMFVLVRDLLQVSAVGASDTDGVDLGATLADLPGQASESGGHVSTRPSPGDHDHDTLDVARLADYQRPPRLLQSQVDAPAWPVRVGYPVHGAPHRQERVGLAEAKTCRRAVGVRDDAHVALVFGDGERAGDRFDECLLELEVAPADVARGVQQEGQVDGDRTMFES